MELETRVNDLATEFQQMKIALASFMSTRSKRFLSVAQVSEKYGWSRRFIYDLIAADKIVPHKVNARTMLLESEIIELIDKGRRAA